MTDNDTPPNYHRTPSEHSIPIPGWDWIEDFKRQMLKGFQKLQDQVDAIKENLQDRRVEEVHDRNKIDLLVSEMARVHGHVVSVDSRVVVLEQKKRDESAVNRALKNVEERSGVRKIADAAYSQIGTGIVLIVAGAVLWLFTHYVGGTKP